MTCRRHCKESESSFNWIYLSSLWYFHPRKRATGQEKFWNLMSRGTLRWGWSKLKMWTRNLKNINHEKVLISPGVVWVGHVPGAGAGPVPGGRPRPPGDRRDPVRLVPPQPPHHDGSHGPHHRLDDSTTRLPAIPGEYGCGYVTLKHKMIYIYNLYFCLVNIQKVL